MKCVVCKHGETKPGRVSVTLERGELTLVLKADPAEVCENCGEQYVDAATTDKLLREAEEAVRAGVRVEVRTFAAA